MILLTPYWLGSCYQSLNPTRHVSSLGSILPGASPQQSETCRTGFAPSTSCNRNELHLVDDCPRSRSLPGRLGEAIASEAWKSAYMLTHGSVSSVREIEGWLEEAGRAAI